jgi:ATP-dependent helicase YprA (DUF1998 family)
VIGEVDQFSAPVLVHDDAVYLHEGRQYHVERLDWEEKRAYVHPVSVDYYTLAETRQTVRILERRAGPQGGRVRHSHGEVRVTRLATMYKKVRFLTHENVGAGPIHLPEQDLHTTSVWMTFAPSGLSGVRAGELETGLLGASRALHAAACLLCMCDPRDLGSHVEVRTQASPRGGSPTAPPLGPPPLSEPQEFAAGWRPVAASGETPPGALDTAPGTDAGLTLHAGVPADAVAPSAGRLTCRAGDGDSETGWPAVYLYDAVPAGVGFAEACFERFAELVDSAIALVDGCDCAGGCPSCVGPAPPGEDGRAAALRLLRLALP